MQKWAKRTSCPFPCDHAPELDTTDLLDHKKSTFYQSQVEAIPPSVPTPRGKDVDLRMFVDSDHALTSIHIHNGP